MNEIPIMHVLYSHQCLVEELECLYFTKSLILMQVVEEVSMFCVFQDDVHLSFLLENLVKLDDIWVSQSSVDKHLSPEVFFINSCDLPSEINLTKLMLGYYFGGLTVFSAKYFFIFLWIAS